MIMLTVGAALVMRNDLAVLAELLGSNSTAALSFE
jgi:hypothetical protein